MADDLGQKCASFMANRCADSYAYQLGDFTWENRENPNSQKGWLLGQEIRKKIADGTVKFCVIAHDEKKIKDSGGLSGIETIINSQTTRFKIDYSAFPWYWSNATKSGGWISYGDLINVKNIVRDSGVIYLKYEIESHPYFNAFKPAMAIAEWGEFALQYGMGINNMPYINAWFCEKF
jgi:hypothetical protein